MINKTQNYQIENDIYNSLILKNDNEDFIFYVCNITIYFILGIILLLLISVLIISNINH